MHENAVKVKEEISEAVASYPTYEKAANALDQLRGKAFPVQYAAIVADGLKLVRYQRVRDCLITLVFTVIAGVSSGLASLNFEMLTGIQLSTLWCAFLGAAIGLFSGLVIFAWTRATIGNERFNAKFFDVVVHGQYANNAREILIPNIKEDSLSRVRTAIDAPALAMDERRNITATPQFSR